MKLTLKSVRAAGFALDSARWEQFRDRLKILFKIDSEKCIKCGACLEKCPFKAITK